MNDLYKYPAVLYKPVTIETIHEEIGGFKTFSFKGDHHINYKAGQYLTFVQEEQGEDIRRSYSIVSSPVLNEPLTIGVKRIENGVFSRKLIDQARPGDVLQTIGAGGLFTLPDDLDSYRQLFFLAAGTGITPILSLLKTVLYGHRQQVVLIYSNHSREQTIFYKELMALETLFPSRLRLHLLFSNAADLSTARLNKVSLQTLVNDYLQTEHPQALYYICGPEAYMRMCTYTLQEEHVPKENIRKENFIIQKVKTHPLVPPDRSPHKVSIDYGGQHYQFTAAYPDTILQAAKKSGIQLPYSCETGRCGSCAARCVSGNVWLSYNEVLTEKDLIEGLTLTCVGHPVNGDVALKI